MTSIDPESILQSVKASIGILPEYDVFDTQLIFCINASLSSLNQIGIGPKEGFLIEGDHETWDEAFGEAVQKKKLLGFAKTYVIMKSRLLFDPPTNGSLVDAMNNQLSEIESRIINIVGYE